MSERANVRNLVDVFRDDRDLLPLDQEFANRRLPDPPVPEDHDVAGEVRSQRSEGPVLRLLGHNAKDHRNEISAEEDLGRDDEDGEDFRVWCGR